MFWLYATLKTRGKLGRVNFRKDFWDCYWRVPSNDPRNHCGTCFGSSSLLVLILLISSSVYTIVFATLKIRGKLGRVNFRKDVWDWYWRVPSNNPRNNCGTHFGSSSLLVSIVLISSSVYTIVFVTLKTRGKLGRVYFGKDFWDWYWRVPSNDRRIIAGHISAPVPSRF